MGWNKFFNYLKRKFIGALNSVSIYLNYGGLRESIASFIGKIKFLTANSKEKEKIVKSIRLVRTSNLIRDGQKLYPMLSKEKCYQVIEEIKQSAHSYRIQDFSENKFEKVANINSIPSGINSLVIEPDVRKKHTKELLEEAIANASEDLLGYFGCKPILDNVNVLYSIPGKAIGPQYFHRDWDSIKFIKLFIYLNDVTSINGPHQFVYGSQIESLIVGRDRYAENEIFETYENCKIRTMIGEAGSNFKEDTRGIHRGLELISGERWLLSARFTLVPSIFRERNLERMNDLHKIFN